MKNRKELVEYLLAKVAGSESLRWHTPPDTVAAVEETLIHLADYLSQFDNKQSENYNDLGVNTYELFIKLFKE